MHKIMLALYILAGYTGFYIETIIAIIIYACGANNSVLNMHACT